MGNFNVGRWATGGVVAGLVIWVLEGALAPLHVGAVTARLTELGLPTAMSTAGVLGSLASTVLGGLVMIFFYALVRGPLGAGAGTAVVVAVALFCGGYVPSLLGYYLLGVFSGGLLLVWAVQGLVEMIVAGIVGAWLYQPRAAA